MKNTTTIIVVITLLVGFYIFTSSNRYYISASKDGISYKIDKRTGETWRIYRGELYPVEEPEAPTPPIQDIPPSEQSKITGNAGLNYGTLFSGKLYNGSQWYVRELLLMITAKDPDEVKAMAENTFRKDRRVTIRLYDHDLKGIQKKALEKGIPYQTLISSMIHQYVEGDLAETKAS